MVGVMQALAGVLRLGAVVDFISSSVVAGYITGAGVLIGIGQLYNATGTEGARGKLWVTVGGWLDSLGDAHVMPIIVALGTVAVVIAVRALNRRTGKRLPSAMVAMTLGLVANVAFGLEGHGLRVVSDLAEIPAGLPPLTMPDLSLAPELVPVAVACAVLSLVESSSVARSIAARTGERLDASTEFFGQGLSNIAAAFFGGYPVSGSLSRSALNERVGAKTRLSGIITGALMIVVLLALGPVLDHTPLASLAGLMFVVAYDLVDLKKIRHLVRASKADATAFFATLAGTWLLSLDLAIYLGVGISVVLFLRRARLVKGRRARARRGGAVRGALTRDRGASLRTSGCCTSRGRCSSARRGSCRTRCPPRSSRPRSRRWWYGSSVRRGLDATAAGVLAEIAARMQASRRRLIVVGVTADDLQVLERSGAMDVIGKEYVFPTRSTWFAAMDAGLRKAREECGPIVAEAQWTAPR